MVAVLGYSKQQIVSAVKEMYTAVANQPDLAFHFPVGRTACEALGYPAAQLNALPSSVLDSFAGVGNPFNARVIRPGDTVLDVGAGAGNDSLIAAELSGPQGRVFALDLTAAMTSKLKASIDEAGLDNVKVLQASAEHVPLPDESVDVVTSNGALNLVPDKRRAVGEMFRVLRPGGHLQIADVVIRRPVTVDCHSDPRLWVECVVGATIDENLLSLFNDAGFTGIETVRTLDYFAHSPSPQTREVAAGFGAYSIELRMRREGRAPSRIWQTLRRMNPRRGWHAIRQRGLVGMAGLILALLTCYGTLAATALLPMFGVSLALNEGVWAGAIAVFTLLTAVAVVAGMRRHRFVGPAILALAGAGIVMYSLYIHYQVLVELAGFILLSGGAGWDLYRKRQLETRFLGLTPAS